MYNKTLAKVKLTKLTIGLSQTESSDFKEELGLCLRDLKMAAERARAVAS